MTKKGATIDKLLASYSTLTDPAWADQYSWTRHLLCLSYFALLVLLLLLYKGVIFSALVFLWFTYFALLILLVLLYEGVIHSAGLTLLSSFYLCYFMKASSTLLLLLCSTYFTCITSYRRIYSLLFVFCLWSCSTLLMNASFTLLFSRYSHMFFSWSSYLPMCPQSHTLAFHGFQKKLKIQLFYIVSSECLKHNLYDHRKRVEAMWEYVRNYSSLGLVSFLLHRIPSILSRGLVQQQF